MPKAGTNTSFVTAHICVFSPNPPALALPLQCPAGANGVSLLGTGTAAILAVGGSKPTVTVDENGRFGVQKVMKCNLTCDHRIVYGAGAAEFMLELKSVIENPEQLTF